MGALFSRVGEVEILLELQRLALAPAHTDACALVAPTSYPATENGSY